MKNRLQRAAEVQKEYDRAIRVIEITVATLSYAGLYTKGLTYCGCLYLARNVIKLVSPKIGDVTYGHAKKAKEVIKDGKRFRSYW